MERRILAEHTVTAQEIRELGPAGVRELIRTLHVGMRDRGIPPTAYVLEGERYTSSDTTTFRALAIDPDTALLTFDDRDIV